MVAGRQDHSRRTWQHHPISDIRRTHNSGELTRCNDVHLLGTAAATVFAPAIVRAQTSGLKVAFVATLSGPGAALGNQLRDGWLLGVKHLDGKLGGIRWKRW